MRLRFSPRQQVVLGALLIVFWSLLLRLPSLDRFVTADEHAWLARAGNFYYALAHGDWAGTFQRHHPGVTVTWAGMVGYWLTYPGYAADAPGQFGWLTEEIEPFLRGQGHDPVTVLAAGRGVSVVLITLAFVGSVTREEHRPGQRIGLSWLGAWAGISSVAMAGLLGVLVQMYVL
jgi:hypothetical protein